MTDASQAGRQQQFLEVIDRDEAHRRFRAHLALSPLESQRVPLAEALERVLAEDVISPISVPNFDRANVDGFAVRAADTIGGEEWSAVRLRLNTDVLAPGIVPSEVVLPGTATLIATGGVLPRGADAVVMVEQTEIEEPPALDGQSASESGPAFVHIRRAASPGENVTFAGTDISRGETVLRAGQLVTARELGVLAAMGLTDVTVWRRPRVAILSTGNEIVPPGAALPTGSVYDSNAAILAASVRELGCEPVPLGIVADDEALLVAKLQEALACDAVLMSGGTSKGAGDLSHRAVAALGQPGIVAHGVSLKPGKPVCLAVVEGKPLAILPGFPTSAIFTFQEFMAPVLRAFAGRAPSSTRTVEATLPVRVHSERGRTEFLLVSLVATDTPGEPRGYVAFPIGKGSGSVTTFSFADGYLTIPQHTEQIPSGSTVDVTLLAENLQPADLVIVGSHCVGLDVLVGEVRRRGFSAKVLAVGSQGGLSAAQRGQCDIAGVHLFDPATQTYNTPFVTPGLDYVRGYDRMQGLVFRPDDARFAAQGADNAHRWERVRAILAPRLTDPSVVMVNRNAGSGTRVLIDQLLGSARPPGFGVQANSHNAVASAVAQGRADWGLCIRTVAEMYGLGFVPLQHEQFDFVIPNNRRARPAVVAFLEALASPRMQQALAHFA